MNRNLISVATAGLLALLPAAAVFAGDAASPEARLRDQLRNSLIQLRNTQTELGNLQATATQDAADKKELGDKLAALTKKSAAEKIAADKEIADLKSKVAGQEARLARDADDLAKWKVAYNQAAAVAQAREAERAKLAAVVIDLQNKLADRETRNRELFKLGTEILGKYEKFGLGEAIAAREPFTGSMRVKLENTVQDFQDKMQSQKATP